MELDNGSLIRDAPWSEASLRVTELQASMSHLAQELLYNSLFF